MADEELEQGAQPSVEQEPEAVSEQGTPVADAVTEPVAEPTDTPVAESPATFDLTTDEGIRAAVAVNPTLAGYLEKTRKDAENDARQRMQSEMRREQGTVERVQQYHRWVVGELEKGRDFSEIAQDAPMFVTANEEALRVEVLRAMLQQAAANGDETADAYAATLKGASDETVVVAQRAINAAIERQVKARTAELEREIEQRVRAKVEAEARASQIESRPVTPNPPATSGVTSTGPSLDATQRLNSMSSEAFKRHSRDEQQDLIKRAREEQASLVASR